MKNFAHWIVGMTIIGMGLGAFLYILEAFEVLLTPGDKVILIMCCLILITLQSIKLGGEDK